MSAEVVLFLVARTDDDFAGAHMTLSTESCLDEAAAIIGCARRGTDAKLRVWEGAAELVWTATATGRIAPCTLERDRRMMSALRRASLTP